MIDFMLGPFLVGFSFALASWAVWKLLSDRRKMQRDLDIAQSQCAFYRNALEAVSSELTEVVIAASSVAPTTSERLELARICAMQFHNLYSTHSDTTKGQLGSAVDKAGDPVLTALWETQSRADTLKIPRVALFQAQESTTSR